MHRLALICLLSVQLIGVLAYPDPGIFSFDVKNRSCNFFHVNKALFKNSKINFKVLCKPNQRANGETVNVKLGIVVRESPCFEEYAIDSANSGILSMYYLCPDYSGLNYKTANYLTKEVKVLCDNYIEQNILDDKNLSFMVTKPAPVCNRYIDNCEPQPLPQILNVGPPDSDGSDRLDRPDRRRRKREVPFVGPKNENDIIIPNDGVYLMVLYVDAHLDYENKDPEYKGETYDVSVEISIKGEHGYLSANDWPFLPFYGFMSLVYLCYAIGWLIVSAMQWKDLLRIQYWIAAVILLGMIEKAVFYLDYSSINSTGVSQVKGAILFAELVSCVKRALSRMLVLIVSLGYGIVKPRLGPLLQRVVLLGILYFIFGSIEAIIRIYRPKNEPANGALITTIPLATLDSIITWWIFTSLMQTTHTLKLRRNMVKHKLYRDFTLVLTVAVIASIAFVIWIMHLYKVSLCAIDWRKLWLETAYWHILFSIMLLIIMVLFRPTNNNQRYAFTLLDHDSDDDDDEVVLIPESLSQGLKMRHQNNPSTGSDQQDILFDRTVKDAAKKKKKEEELNTIVDTAFPILIDSEDELINKQLELSKME